LRQQAKDNIRKYVDERLPEEYEKCLVGLNAIVKEAWNTSQQTDDRREKLQALSLAKECYGMKLDLLTNATVVDEAIRFVTEHGKSITNASSEVATAAPAAINANINTVVNSQWSEATDDIHQQSLNKTTKSSFLKYYLLKELLKPNHILGVSFMVSY
jgi:hypothetical protein